VGDIAGMKARLFAVAMAMFGLSACAERPGGNSEADAQFRHAARETYEALISESCTPNPALRRETVLARERALAQTFEQHAEAAVRLQLDIARNDLAHRRSSGHVNCWDDRDERFAARHVEMARNSARTGLAEMESLVPRLTSLPASTADLPAEEGAAFRARVFSLVEALNMPCQGTRAARNEVVRGPAMAELNRFRERIGSTPYAPHFDIARADALYEGSIWTVECVEPEDIPAAEASRRALDETKRQIAQMAAAAHL